MYPVSCASSHPSLSLLPAKEKKLSHLQTHMAEISALFTKIGSWQSSGIMDKHAVDTILSLKSLEVTNSDELTPSKELFFLGLPSKEASRFSHEQIDLFYSHLKALNLDVSLLTLQDALGLRLFQLLEQLISLNTDASGAQKKAWVLDFHTQQAIFYTLTYNLWPQIIELKQSASTAKNRRAEEEIKQGFEAQTRIIFQSLRNLVNKVSSDSSCQVKESFLQALTFLESFTDKNSFYTLLINRSLNTFPEMDATFGQAPFDVRFESVERHFRYLNNLQEGLVHIHFPQPIEKKYKSEVMDHLDYTSLAGQRDFVKKLSSPTSLELCRQSIHFSVLLTQFMQLAEFSEEILINEPACDQFLEALYNKIHEVIESDLSDPAVVLAPALVGQKGFLGLYPRFLTNLADSCRLTLDLTPKSFADRNIKSISVYHNRITMHFNVYVALISKAQKDPVFGKLKSFNTAVFEWFRPNVFKEHHSPLHFLIAADVNFQEGRFLKTGKSLYLRAASGLRREIYERVETLLNNWQEDLNLDELKHLSTQDLIRGTCFICNLMFIMHDVDVASGKYPAKTDEEIFRPYLEFLVDLELALEEKGLRLKPVEIVDESDVSSSEESERDESEPYFMPEPLETKVDPIPMPDDVTLPSAQEDQPSDKSAGPIEPPQLAALEKLATVKARGPSAEEIARKEKRARYLERERLIKAKARELKKYLKSLGFSEKGSAKGSHQGYAMVGAAELGKVTVADHHESDRGKRGTRTAVIAQAQTIAAKALAKNKK